MQGLRHTVTDALDQYGHEDAVFMAHSLGNTGVSWVLKDPETAKRVHSTILMDPVTLLLCNPRVATSFIYRDPYHEEVLKADPTRSTAMQLVSHFFVARELLVANALSRHFEWSQNILFTEEMPGYGGVGAAQREKESSKGRRRSGLSSGGSSDWGFGSLGSEGELTSSSAPDAESEGPVSSQGAYQRRGGAEPAAAAAAAGCSSRSKGIGSQAFRGAEEAATRVSAECRNTIFLSTHDAIVPSEAVGRYLGLKQNVGGQKHYEYFVVSGEHGSMLLNPRWMGVLAAKVRQYSGLPAHPDE